MKEERKETGMDRVERYMAETLDEVAKCSLMEDLELITTLVQAIESINRVMEALSRRHRFDENGNEEAEGQA